MRPQEETGHQNTTTANTNCCTMTWKPITHNHHVEHSACRAVHQAGAQLKKKLNQKHREPRLIRTKHPPDELAADTNTHKPHTHTHSGRRQRQQGRAQGASDGSYTSAFARRADGGRALRWRERQRAAETEMKVRQALRRSSKTIQHSCGDVGLEGGGGGPALVWF